MHNVCRLRVEPEGRRPTAGAALAYPTYGRIKNVLDPVLAAIVLVLVVPFLFILAVLIKIESRGPILFRQPRYGCRGEIFEIYKFRTIKDSERDLPGARQVEDDDERLTRLGPFLRKTALDELPQLINVVKGEMFLVGPRPHPTGMLVEGVLCNNIVSAYFDRLNVKPGITGWAQVNRLTGPIRSAEALRSVINHDLYYLRHRSPAFDVLIILKTAVSLVSLFNLTRRVWFPGRLAGRVRAARRTSQPVAQSATAALRDVQAPLAAAPNAERSP